MDFFEALQWTNWKNLTAEVKSQVFQQVVMYFVSPLKEITDVHFIKTSYAGIKCETFELTIDEEPFVFVPGNYETILGWDLGIQGLPITCWSKMWQEPLSPSLRRLIKGYGLSNAEEWGDFVNESMSPLRKATIPPMLVQKMALPAGTRLIGELDTVTGEFHGHVDQFETFGSEIRQAFQQPRSFEESLQWEMPRTISAENQYFAELYPVSGNYHVYTHQRMTQNELQHWLGQQGYDLMNEEQWEYAVGAGTRRLFRWGNEKPCEDGVKLTKKALAEPNMFGLIYPYANGWELTDSSFLKMEDWPECGNPLLDTLPYASYYRSRKMLQANQQLDPEKYRYRKAVIIDRERI
ncbi:hypothetical protein ABE927_07945 [Enterococcus gallinarum]|uniref:DUF7278 family profilin-like fold-containing protein n=1 Tax=Enterococcus gallinarum TaxID=1353 RepID=UPI003D6AEEF4